MAFCKRQIYTNGKKRLIFAKDLGGSDIENWMEFNWIEEAQQNYSIQHYNGEYKVLSMCLELIELYKDTTLMHAIKKNI